MWWFLLSFQIAVRQPTTMAPIFACRFLIYSWTDYIHLHQQSVLQEPLPLCSYHIGLGSDYLWAARRRSVFRSTLGILFPQYPLYLDSVPRSATWGGARWSVTTILQETYHTQRQNLKVLLYRVPFSVTARQPPFNVMDAVAFKLAQCS
jgi:hypothetical protein